MGLLSDIEHSNYSAHTLQPKGFVSQLIIGQLIQGTAPVKQDTESKVDRMVKVKRVGRTLSGNFWLLAIKVPRINEAA